MLTVDQLPVLMTITMSVVAVGCDRCRRDSKSRPRRAGT